MEALFWRNIDIYIRSIYNKQSATAVAKEYNISRARVHHLIKLVKMDLRYTLPGELPANLRYRLLSLAKEYEALEFLNISKIKYIKGTQLIERYKLNEAEITAILKELARESETFSIEAWLENRYCDYNSELFKSEFLKERVSILFLPSLTASILRSNRVNTVGILTAFSKKELIRFRNMGKKGVRDVEEALLKYNLELSKNNPRSYRSTPLVKKEVDSPLLKRAIETLSFTTRTYNCLRSLSIRNIEELITSSPKELLEARHFGKASLKEVVDVLAKYNLTLCDTK